MIAATKSPEEMTLEELMHQKTAGHAPGNPMLDRINTAIQVRLAEKQDATARALVKGTDGLVASTSRLVRATWGLVCATAALVIAEVILKVIGRS